MDFCNNSPHISRSEFLKCFDEEVLSQRQLDMKFWQNFKFFFCKDSFQIRSDQTWEELKWDEMEEMSMSVLNIDQV